VLAIVTVIDIAARVVFLVVTTVIFGIALLTYSRLRNRKTQLLAVGFGLFFVHGLISIPELLFYSYNIEFTDSLHLLIDAVALLIILLGVLKE
jgi:hypothetical protein